MLNLIKKLRQKISQKNITNSGEVGDIYENREMNQYPVRDIGESKIAETCPYCASKKFVKRGKRKKKLEVVQLYLCKKCGKTFTAQFIKGKHYPTKLIINALSIYNLGYSLEETCRIINKKFEPAGLRPATLNAWYKEYSSLCRYCRLRPYGMKLYPPEKTVEALTLAHRQIYHYRFHRAKTDLMLDEYKHYNLAPIRDYLESVFTETPHQYFQTGARISEVKTKFNKAQMIVRSKQNYANRLADFVLQAVSNNRQRHEEVQKFMLANDSVTVASEVPVYIRGEDIEHMENQLDFEIGDMTEYKNEDGRILLTGHIDLLQIRNGQIHILDFKPGAAKVRPIEQLTWYALALSRLTGLRLYEFKCAWFDHKDYFEFYPLHVVKKIRDKKTKRKIYLKSRGTSVEVPEEDLGRKVKIIK